jgi:hypothetical protein
MRLGRTTGAPAKSENKPLSYGSVTLHMAGPLSRDKYPKRGEPDRSLTLNRTSPGSGARGSVAVDGPMGRAADGETGPTFSRPASERAPGHPVSRLYPDRERYRSTGASALVPDPAERVLARALEDREECARQRTRQVEPRQLATQCLQQARGGDHAEDEDQGRAGQSIRRWGRR